MKAETTTANPLEEQNYKNDMPCILVKTSQGNIHIGYLKERNGDTVILTEARRLWYWNGAAGVNQIASEGLKFPEKCKVPCPVEIELLGIIEILPVTNKSKAVLDSIKVWRVDK